MLKTLKILIGLLCFHICGNAQISSKDSIKIDSFKEIISRAKHDTIKINALIAWDNIIYVSDAELDFELNQQIAEICNINLIKELNNIEIQKFNNALSFAYNNIGLLYKKKANYEKALEFLEKSMNIGKEIGDKSRISNSYSSIGLVYYNQSKYEKAIDYHEKCLEIKKEIGDKRGTSNSSNNLGITYYQQGNYEKALEYYEISLEIYKETGDKSGMAASYNNIGNIYLDQGNYDKALEFHEKSLVIRKDIGDKSGMAASYNNIGNIYNSESNYDKALEYFEKCLEIKKEIGIKIEIASTYNNIGNIYNSESNYDKALEYFEKGLVIRKDIGDKSGMASSYYNIGILYKKKDNYEKALEYLLNSKKIFLDINIVLKLDITAKSLMEVYEKLDKPQKALENHKLYVAIKDSLSKMDGIEKEKQRQFHEQYLLEKQADSIKHSNEVSIQKAETLAKQEQLTNETQRRNGLIIISLLVLVTLCFVFIQLKKVRNKKDIIELKQIEINDSINYANRLQKGILPPESFIKNCLPKSFMLFKPKDVVSGDFYWVEKVGSKIYFGVADCTGHGVPGAMVSIVCSNALTKSLFEDNITSPAKILDNTRTIVENKFIRSKDDIKDGMDISLASLDTKNNSLLWSGANNPLWIVRNKGNEIEEIKPTKQAIGKILDPKPFMEHQVKLNKGDIVYLFSDGFSDQFGGEKGKKYKSANFKKFLLSISDKSMGQQKQLLSNEFYSWKGDLEQIDDVCVMGVKI